MGTVRQTRSGRYELTVRHRLLPKTVYLTFDSSADAVAYGDQVDALLRAGVVPAALLERSDRGGRSGGGETIAGVVRAWRMRGELSAADDAVLGQVLERLSGLRVAELSYRWAEAWISELKRSDNLAPGTIHKRVGALARALDWYARAHPDVGWQNPLRLLPRGYATYTAADARALEPSGRGIRRDVERDRRLGPGEEQAIERALAGERRPDRERALQVEPAFVLLYRLILATGVRLREAYTLRRDQVSASTIRVRCSKSVDGAIEWRDVPLIRSVRPLLAAHVAELEPGALVFPWWSGDESDLHRVTALLSRRFGILFAYAGLTNLTEHDLRHEATCRWFELRAPDGSWLFREQEIRRIMGWSPRSPMPARYASFRAEDLADRL